MSERITKINELLRREIAEIISREGVLENGLVTITKIRTGTDLKNATILISVLPTNLSGTALKQLKHLNSLISAQLRKKLKIKNIPRFNWKIDGLERHAVEVEDAINSLDLD